MCKDARFQQMGLPPGRHPLHLPFPFPGLLSQLQRTERAFCPGVIIQLCPDTYHIFSLRAGLSGGPQAESRDSGASGAGRWRARQEEEAWNTEPAALLHATGLLHLESEGQAAWRPGGGGGLGETGSGERALTRLRCCPSPGGRSTEPDKPQAVFRRGRAGGCRIRRPHNWSWSTHRRSAHLPDCGAASSRASALTASLLVNVAAGTASLADVGPTAPCSALRSCPRLSLAGLSSGWLLLGYRALGLRGGLDEGPWWDSAWHGPPRRGRPLLAASFWKKAPLTTRLWLVASPPRAAEQGRGAGVCGRYFMKRPSNTCLSLTVGSVRSVAAPSGREPRDPAGAVTVRTAAGPGDKSCFKAETNPQVACQGRRCP